MKTILIVEGGNFLQKSLEAKLADAGFVVVHAQDAVQAGVKIKDRPNIVLIDVALPVVGGLSFLTQKQKDLEKIPVIAVLGEQDPTLIDNLLSLGVKDYLVKDSFDVDEAAEKIIQNSGIDRSAPKSSGAESPARVPGQLAGKTIMWVEDDEFLSEIIRKKLSTEGCKLMRAARGEEAIDLVKSSTPDLILLDIILPGMNGLQVLKALKADPQTQNIPVIMLSNLDQPSDRNMASQQGALDFFVKATVSLDDVVSKIRGVLAR